MNYLSLDVGTTRCKCQLFSQGGDILEERSADYGFLEKGGETYVSLSEIERHVTAMIRGVAKGHAVDSLCISSFGESFVLLGKDDEILFDSMLYTDPRGEEEAEELLKRFGKEKLFFTTGVLPQSMYSICKLLWIKKHAPGQFGQAKKLLLLCDYLGYRLTGERVIDYALASRTGVFNFNTLQFDGDILDACGIPSDLFSRPAPTGSVVGKVKGELAQALGLPNTCTVVLGSHDQVCASLGAGVLKEGDAVDGMGTVECITTLFSTPPKALAMGEQGYVCVPYAVKGLYCTYMFNYSCGSLVNWYRHLLGGDNFFARMEKEMPDRPTRLLALPYFSGAATPYQNVNAKGGILNLTTQTTEGELYRALLEGTAMEMRLNAEIAAEYGISVKRAVATGGGANSEKWLQIKADIQGIPFKTLRSSEGGLCGCAMLQAVAMGSAKDLSEAAKTFIRYEKELLPQNRAAYEAQYKKYKKLYHTLKEFY